MNTSHSINQPAFPTIPSASGMPKLTYENIVDPSSLDGGDSDSEDGFNVKQGKKTRGRVKIKMEFIENKLRRYTTFSKRKTGIMKKAYELSTLTGTQVMLLVASETGHVYTFATRKLQPMITSDSGKALIQTCLNSPDPPPGSTGPMSIEQRMNPTGFEETELSYAVSEEENVKNENNNKPVYTVSSLPCVSTSLQQAIEQEIIQSSSSSSPAPQVHVTSSSPATPQQTTNRSSNVAVQIPGLPPGTVLVPPGTPLIPIQQQNGQTSGVQQGTGQTLYRLPNSNQIVSIPNVGTNLYQASTETTQQTIVTPSSSTSSSSSSNVLQTLSTPSATAMTPGVVMYQTPQGIVYAPTTATLQDRPVFNFQQPAQPLSLSQNEGGQQYITIPVPVSLGGNTQLVQLGSTDSPQQVTLSQPSAAKKTRK